MWHDYTLHTKVYRGLWEDYKMHSGEYIDIIRKEVGPLDGKTNLTCQMTGWRALLEYKEMRPLIHHIGRAVSTRTGWSLIAAAPKEMWGAIYHEGDEAKPHDHLPWRYSFCFYFQPSLITIGDYQFAPSEGELLIWPSHFTHYVTPVSGERIIIAGNI